MVDVRDQASGLRTKTPKSAKDIEAAQWHPAMEHYFAVTTESGIVLGYDTRKIEEPVFSL